ncbi:uncharacterized protein LODBEIA_P16530 [Lodderomyces beijingensis]|uniref:Uncharacterized protein n=1 Tax=Lodderomyces beijingensis TaxID=1775926 RepID=A0ABP0ZHR3_9ASCO
MKQNTFLALSTEVSEPFIIPNVSPISSPKLEGKSRADSISGTVASDQRSQPLVAHGNGGVVDGDELLSSRKSSAIDLS